MFRRGKRRRQSTHKSMQVCRNHEIHSSKLPLRMAQREEECQRAAIFNYLPIQAIVMRTLQGQLSR